MPPDASRVAARMCRVMRVIDRLRAKWLNQGQRPEVLWTEEAIASELSEIERRRASAGISGSTSSAKETLEQRAARLRLTALCLSGGGIRSAAFSLGVLQALAARTLLNEFDYLSTVSGGGFIGGWLQMFLRETKDAVAAQQELGKASATSVQALRAYTNYLTPHTGPFSSDTWAAVVLFLRNLLLNWLIFSPVFLLLALVPIFYRTVIRSLCDDAWISGSLLAFGGIALVIASWQGCTLLPSHRTASLSGFSQSGPINSHIVAPALVWAWLVPFTIEFALARRSGVPVAWRGWVLYILPAVYFAAILIGYGIAWILHRDRNPNGRALYGRNFWRWFCATLCSGLLLFLGLVLVLHRQYVGTYPLPHSALYNWADRHVFNHSDRLLVDTETTLALLFPGWIIVTHLLQTTFYVGFRKEGLLSDLDREWLARLSGSVLRFGIAWMMLALCCLVLPAIAGFVNANWRLEGTIGGTTLLGGAVAWIAKRAPAGIEAIASNPGRYQITLLNALSLIFAIGVLAATSGLLHYALGLVQLAVFGGHGPFGPLVAVQALLMIVLIMLIIFLARDINVNRFSMHAVYRNRLVRAFLGVARNLRDPDPFTGFDPRDNPRFKLFLDNEARQRLFPVINMTLNMTVGSNTAWAERQAASFTATPLACGSATLRHPDQTNQCVAAGAFTATCSYAGKDSPGDQRAEKLGVRIGTMLTISGAAVSPNWGYHSSRLTAFLMTLFNVRLGAWLPNPAVASAEAMALAQPKNAIFALMSELLGQTTDATQAVYLSDGGHFENLGLYEMLRRRCHRIVVVDAGQDPDCSMFDLGNAIRKSAIDLGVQVRMRPMRIFSRSTLEHDKEAAASALGFAVGDIEYLGDPPGQPSGRLVYLKPSFLSGIPADVRAYGGTDQHFPHDSTLEQWFTESQFESYRALGAWQMNELLGSQCGGGPLSLDALYDAAERECPAPIDSDKAIEDSLN